MATFTQNNINYTDEIKQFRLVYDEIPIETFTGKVVMVEELEGLTRSKHQIFTALTESECLAKISELNLKPLAQI